jgi:hypothetical protein
LPVETKIQDLVRLAKQRWIIERDYDSGDTEGGGVTPRILVLSNVAGGKLINMARVL